MALSLYKRAHAPRCLRTLAQKGITDPEQLKYYRACRCAWWVDNGVSDSGQTIRRHSLKVYTWEAAQAALKKLHQGESAERRTLAGARDKWVRSLRLRNLGEVSIGRYAWAVQKLLDYCAAKGIADLVRVQPETIDDLRGQWLASGVAFHTHRNELSWISMFFRYAVRMRWITENPVDGVDRPRRPRPAAGEDEDGEAEGATLPLDRDGDANYRRILAAIPAFWAAPRRGREGVFWKRPENFLALCELMYETGLRVSDAIHFRRERLRVDAEGGVYTTRQIKTGNPVTVFLEPWLVEKLLALPEIAPGYIFFDGRRQWKDFIRAAVSRPLEAIGPAAGVAGVRPHRFRDSFAVNALNQGLRMEELQKLLGHKSLATTEEYYAPFVRSRERHLRSRVLAAKAAPPPKVVSIERRQTA